MTEQNALIIPGVDTTGLTEAEKQELAVVLGQNFEESRDGIDFRPQRYKINKDAQVFVDPFGNSIDELVAAVLYKQKVRGCWEEGNKTPLCSSFDAIEGIDGDGNRRKCASCPQNAWGSGKKGKGKACKEMRRLFLMTQNNALPIQISFPPTSISPIDNFFSARLTNRIPDIAKEVKFSLTKQTNDGFDFAVAIMKNGKDFSATEMLDLNRLRSKFVEGWKHIAIDDDEYMQGAESGVDDGQPY
ncbi:MAG: hypothetical protein NC238_02865 [Dehalobacter sp.]|nr:hypothetical protein [Dehalobacter sp.]